MRHVKPGSSVLVFVAAGLLAAWSPSTALAAEDPVGTVTVEPSGLSVLPRVEYEKLLATVGGPDDFARHEVFERGQGIFVSLLDEAGNRPPDGTYAYELSTLPYVDPDLLRQIQIAREAGDEKEQRRLAALLPRGAVQSGFFTILDGAVVPGGQEEPRQEARDRAPARPSAAPAAAEAPAPRVPDGTVLTNADGIIRNSLCVGFDCPNSPTFDDTTVLLMENNTRIKYDDTSTLSGFPNRDWALNANDSASGGASRFWVQDCGSSSSQGGCSGNAVFSIEAGARTNALWVDSNNNIGVGTAAPVTALHAVKGDTPALRLNQDGSSGFAPQTWDVAGNETSFFVRDATNGSKLPLRIRPGAPTSSLDVGATGNVGIGTASPSSALHVRRTDGTAKLFVEEAFAGGATDRVLMHLQNTSGGKSRFLIQSGAALSPGTTWSFDNNFGSSFTITQIAGPTVAFTLQANGDLTIGGTLTQNSDRTTKSGIEDVDAQAVLAKVARLPISTWYLETDPAEARHMGPMAQDFAAAFGLGADERHISPIDVSGVALAAIQALNEAVSAKDARIAAQQAQIEALTERLAAVEQAIAASRP